MRTFLILSLLPLLAKTMNLQFVQDQFPAVGADLTDDAPDHFTAAGGQPQANNMSQQDALAQSVGLGDQIVISDNRVSLKQPAQTDGKYMTQDQLNFEINRGFSQGILYNLMQRSLLIYHNQTWGTALPSPADEEKQIQDKIASIKNSLGMTDDQVNKLTGQVWHEFCAKNGNVDAQGNCVWGAPK